MRNVFSCLLYIYLIFSQIACHKKPLEVDAQNSETAAKSSDKKINPKNQITEKSSFDDNFDEISELPAAPILPPRPLPAPVQPLPPQITRVPVPVPVPVPAPVPVPVDEEDFECSLKCDDTNVCTEDIIDDDCNCRHVPQSGLYCSIKNDLCTFGLCQQGVCEDYQRVNCNNQNPCITQNCNPATGNCDSTNKSNGTACDDNDPCTDNTTCTNGVCGGGIDTCPAGACPSNCDDNNPCTNDLCNGGTCVNTPAPGLFCAFEDNLCTLGECNDAGACVLFYTKQCVSSNPCATQSCDPTTGNCSIATSLPDGADCEVFCPPGHTVTSPTCIGGICTCDAPPGCPTDCNDNNPCTNDVCNGTVCEHTPQLGLFCELDQNLCTYGLCEDVNGVAACNENKNVECDNDNPCTSQTCNTLTGHCDSTNKNNGTPCDDNDPCTNNTTCTNGVCGGGVITCPAGACPNNCDDNNPCTNDLCNGGTCVNTPAPGLFCAFEDNLCTLGECNDAGACVLFYSKQCVSSNPCATQSCDPTTGNCSIATSLPDGTDCEVFCPPGHTVTSPTCIGGICTCDAPPGCPTDCNDNNPCTNDVCNGTVCEHTPQLGLFCELDQNLCTYGLCEDVNGVAACNESKNVECDNDNPCTSQTCNTLTGHCDVTNLNGISCNDNNPCTANTICTNGTCGGGTPLDCDDGNICTNDQCTPEHFQLNEFKYYFLE